MKSELKSENHDLHDCFAVWYGRTLDFSKKETWAAVEEICEQGYADYYLDGTNKEAAKKARRAR